MRQHSRGTWTLAVATILAGCASSSGALPDRDTRQTVQISGVSGKLNMSSSSSATTTTIAEPIELVWRALPKALDSLGVAVTTIDPARFLIGAEGVKVRQRLGKAPLSRYLDCGQTQIGPNADAYDVMLTVMVQLQKGVPGATNVSTSVEATAKPIAYAQSASECSTKGTFEKALLAILQAPIAK
jgi:hypothetical protein